MEKKGKFRKGVFIVAYSKTNKGIRYLLLKRKLHWVGWEFPKGGIEPKEKIEESIKRELKEETGQLPYYIEKHNFSGKYLYEQKFEDRKGFKGQTFSLFSAEIKKSKIKIDQKEHSDYLWLTFNDALKKLTYENQKISLQIVNDFLILLSKFRNMKTASGKLVLAGKNDKNNEELVSQIEPEEIVFHTAKPGSPFVNIKGKANKQDIREAAIFCARHSQDWRDNHSDVEVHFFKGKDIKKRKGMKVGSFEVKNAKSIKIKKEEIKKCL